MERLQHLVQTTSVRMLFLDDLQHLLNRDTQRIRFACVDVLEEIIVKTGISIVILGSLRETEPLFRLSPRLERVVGSPCILRPFDWNSAATIHEFRALLNTIDQVLPLDEERPDAGPLHNPRLEGAAHPQAEKDDAASPISESQWDSLLTHLNQRFELHFATLDLLIVVADQGLPLGQPTPVAGRDSYTGYLPDVTISFEPLLDQFASEQTLEKRSPRIALRDGYTGYVLGFTLTTQASEQGDPAVSATEDNV